MKYFTADRYKANQAIDDDAAAKANDDWEEQLRLYDERLKEIDGKLPESVKLFMKTCCLHDADFDNWACFSLSSPSVVELVIRQRNWGDHKFVCVLRYQIAPPGYVNQVTGDWSPRLVDQIVHNHDCWDRPEFKPAKKFDRRNDIPSPYWLYDEWDWLGTADGALGKQEVFSHSMLLSNGVEFKIMFSEFEFLFIPIGEGFVES